MEIWGSAPPRRPWHLGGAYTRGFSPFAVVRGVSKRWARDPHAGKTYIYFFNPLIPVKLMQNTGNFHEWVWPPQVFSLGLLKRAVHCAAAVHAPELVGTFMCGELQIINK